MASVKTMQTTTAANVVVNHQSQTVRWAKTINKMVLTMLGAAGTLATALFSHDPKVVFSAVITILIAGGGTLAGALGQSPVNPAANPPEPTDDETTVELGANSTTDAPIDSPSRGEKVAPPDGPPNTGPANTPPVDLAFEDTTQ